MRRFLFLLILVIPVTVFSCSKLGEQENEHGKLCVRFTDGSELLTKAYANLPDTCEFILKVTSSSGKTVYEGKYGDCPEVLELNAGNYVVAVKSSDFSKPSFDSPQFGDEQCVTVNIGKSTCVSLECTQINSGVRLDVSDEFKSNYSDAVLILKSSAGSLMYSVSEKRIAYFTPGTISVIMSRGSVDEVLMVKDLDACNIYTIRISTPQVVNGLSGCDMQVAVDTSRIWNQDECIVGGVSSSGNQIDDAMTIAEVRNAVGSEDVWVSGYIVGGDLTSTNASYSAPFKSMTNILLGPRSSVSDRESCIAVQLPDNEVRSALNLVDNPHLLGRRVMLKGDVVGAYFGLCGLKNTVEYMLN